MTASSCSLPVKVVKEVYSCGHIKEQLFESGFVASQAMTAGAIAANFDTARPTVSKHLQILTECELLKPEQNGREIYYPFNPQKMKEVADFIEPFRLMWEDRFNKLE
jgi:DNA-binding transcriptional ArsR family regulator